MSRYKKPILAFFCFTIIQLVVSFIVMIPMTLIVGAKQVASGNSEILSDPDKVSSLIPSSMLAIVLVVSSLVSIFFMQKPMKMISLKDSFKMPTMPLGKTIGLIVVSFIGIYATNIFSELAALPNLIEAELGDMSKTFIGILAIAVLGPIAEEVTFRGAIQGHLHNNGETPWRAIFISSILFGLIHLNPAQIPFAMVVGAILGVFYYKEKSLVIPCIIHILNNGLSCLLTNVASEDASLVELLGGTAIAVTLGIAGLALCGWVLYKYAVSKETAEMA